MEQTNNNLPDLPTDISEVEKARADIFLPGDEWMETDISNDWLNPEDEWERAKNALFIGDAPVCTLGGLTLLTGQSGNGKTMTIAMMAAAVFRGEYGQFVRGQDITEPTLLYVDTEMEKYNTQRLMNRVYYLNGWEFKTHKPQFRILRLRDTVSVADRWRKVLKAIHEMKPTFCILDGLLDLVRDFNDNVECQQLIYKLMAAASWYDMSVVGVIHQNPGGDKMAGHLGSFGERKAVTVLATKKDKTGAEVLFVVDQKKARDKDADDMKFRVNDDRLHIGIPEPINTSDVKKLQKSEHEELRGIMQLYVPTPGSISQTQLQKEIKNGEHIGSNKAYDLIMRAYAEGIIKKSEVTGKFFLCWDDPLNPNNVEQTKLEF